MSIGLASARTVSWTGGGGNNLWQNPANWSGGVEPGRDDDVIIPAGTFTVVFQSASRSVKSLQCDSGFTLEGGSLTLGEGASRLGGAALLKGGELVVRGNGALFAATGETILESTDLKALEGGQLSLPNMRSIVPSSYTSLSIEAAGPGSLIELPVLAQITMGNGYLYFRAKEGGEIMVRQLSSQQGSIHFIADGEDSQIDLSGLNGCLGNAKDPACSLEARNGGAIFIPLVTSLENVDLAIQGLSEISLGQLVSMRHGELHLDEAIRSLPGLTSLDGSDVLLQNGAQLTLAGITQLVKTNGGYPTLRVMGEGSVLSLPNLTGGSVVDSYQLRIWAEDGGRALLPRLNRFQGDLNVYAAGEGSLVDLSGWTGAFGGATPYRSEIEARDGGSILIPHVTALHRVQLTLAGTGDIPVSQITSFRQGEIQLSETTRVLPGLTNLDGSDVLLQNGAQLTLAGITQLVKTNGGYPTLRVMGEGSVLSLPNLTGGSVASSYQLRIWAEDGGRALLPRLNRFQGDLNVYAAGEGSLVDLSGWTGAFGGATPYRSEIEARDGGSILIPHVTALHRVQLTLAGTGAIPVSQITSMRHGQIELSGTTRVLPGLADLDGSDVLLQNGAQLTLAGITQLVKTNGGYPTLRVMGEGSVLSLPNLTGGSVASSYQLRIWAEDGGRALLPRLNRFQGDFNVYAAGEGSLVDLSGWTGAFGGATPYRSELEARDGGSILIPNVTALDRIELFLQGTGAIPTAQLVALTRSQVVVDGARINFGALADTTGTTFQYLNNGTAVFATPVDLAVTRIEAPATVLAGHLAPIVWELTNRGISLTNGTWSDALFLSTDTQPGGDTLIDLLPAAGSLPHGAVLRITNLVAFPAERRGTHYLAVAVNQSRTVFEGTNYLNNTNVASVPIRIQAPDLILESVSVQPSSAQLGQSVSVTWNVRNTGDAAATGEWTDRWWLSSSPSSLADAVYLFGQDITGGLAPGTQYSRSATVTLPLSYDLNAGGYYVFGETDPSDAIEEANEANNTNSARLTVSLPPLPDLVAGNLRLPALGASGQPLQLVWTVANQGAAAALGLWSEAVFLTRTNTGAVPQRLWIGSFTNDLAQGAFLTRTQQIVLPEDFKAGVYRCAVEVNQDRALREGNVSNNRHTASPLLQVPAALVLRVPVAVLPENMSPPLLTALVLRNGDLSAPLTLALTHGGVNLLTAPSQVTIGAGESSAPFAITVRPDGVPLDDQPVTLTASAGGYQSGSFTILVRNTDLPRLKLELAAATLLEGKTVAATISHDFARKPALEVSFSTPNPMRLLFPEKITIPAGASSTTFVLLAVDNSQVEAPIPCFLQAASPGFVGASAGLSVLDDDLPVFTLALSPATVSEGAGVNAVTATLSRGSASPRSLSVVLSNSLPAVVTVPSRLVIPAGQASVSFPVAVINNGDVDGTKIAALRAYAEATASGALIASSGTALLTVLDDDGPALRLTLGRDLVAEGVPNATTLTVGRNTAVTLPLSVSLSCSEPSRVLLPATLVIPAGQSNASLTLSTLPAAGEDGNRLVQITASAPAFVNGGALLTITDLTRPDLIVTEVNVPDQAETEGFANVSYRVLNQGMGPARSNWVTRVFLSKDAAAGEDTLLTEYAFNGALPVGEYFGQSRQVRMPQVPGRYWIIVATDTADQILEALENNNITISAKPILVDAAYRASVETDFEKGPAGTVVPLRGVVTKTSTGGPEPFALANIHIYVRGTQRILSALADEFGRFSTTFTPLPGEAGLYEIGAAHPGQADAVIQDSFTLYGLKAEPVPSLKMTERSTLTGQTRIGNLGDLPLTGLAVSVVSNTTPLQITAHLEKTSLSGLEKMRVGFALAAGDGAVPRGAALLRVASAEGARLDIPLVVTVESLAPRLVVRPAELRAGMKVGGQAFVSFEIVNEGGSRSDPIQIVVPDLPWLHVATQNPLPPLEPGATNQVMLHLTPSATLALGAYEGALIILGGAGQANLPFNFRALSEAKGDLKVTVEDEYTYYAEGSPRVGGASVLVRDAVSEQVVAQGVTDAAGSFLASQLPEGYYAIQVKAENHSSYDKIHLVVAGFETNVVALISRQAVRLIWKVTPTEIQDRTKITIESVFEAFVPMPVVTVDPALIDLSEYTADVTQIELRVTNHGLVAAQKARLQFGTHPDWSFHPLLDDLGDLPARSTLVVPLLIRRTVNSSAPRFAPTSLMAARSGGGGGGGGCSVGAMLEWELPCAVSALAGGQVIAIINAKSSGCGGEGAGYAGGGEGAGGGGPGSGGRGGMGVSGEGPDSCDPCMLAIFKCLVDFVMPDLGSCIKNSATCAQQASKGASWEAAGECLKAILACLEAAGKEGLKPINKALDAAECLKNLKEGCGTSSGSGGNGGSGGNNNQQNNLPASQIAQASLADGATGGSHVERAELAILYQRGDWLTREIAPVRYLFGNDAWFGESTPERLSSWLRSFNAFSEAASEEGLRISSQEIGRLMARPLPESVNATSAQAFVDRWNRSVDYWKAGLFHQNQVPAGHDTDFLAMDVLSQLLESALEAQQEYRAAGYASSDEAYRRSYDDLFKFLNQGDSEGVCAHVRIRLEQELVSARDAFDASLEIENALLEPLENIAVELMIRKSTGESASDLFAIYPPGLAGINAVDGTGLISGRASGKIHWLITPTTQAAVQGPVEYLVAGMLRYRQGQLNVTAPLPPVKITVYPCPSLKVKYFHQREVFADDPFTVEIEPSVPYSLGVMVENKGHGAARDVRISSAQPKIVENDKGLFVDFKIIATEVAGRNLDPSLTVDFGQIDPGTNAIGRWLLTSTLMGGFIEYSATFEHLNGLGQKKLSLVEGVEIHELIHIVQAPGARHDGRPDFLANDIADLYHRPDTLHLSDGSIEPVSVVEEAVFQGQPSETQREVSMTAPLPPGWVYLRISNPWGNAFRLDRVVRSDGLEIALGQNVWTTDRTFLGNARRPIPEHVLHLFDWNSTGHYTLIFAELPGGDGVAPISRVAALPAESGALIPVCWDGDDNAGGSGISFFDVYVSVEGGPFQLWQEETIDRSAQYQGALGKTYAFYSVATDKAGNREEPPATADARTRVTRINRAPTLAAIPDQSIREGQILTIQPVAHDPDGDSLIFSLQCSIPGLLIEPYTGKITWVTGPGSGPSAAPVMVRVLDSGLPRMGAERAFTVTVGDVNTPPLLPPMADQRIEEGQKLVLSCAAQDADLPRQTLAYSLGSGAPPGASLDSRTGIFTWQPTVFQGGTTNVISIQVSDNGTPPLSATRSFAIVVLDTQNDFEVSLGLTNVLAGQSGVLDFVLDAASDLVQVDFEIEAADSHLANLRLVAAGDEVLSTALNSIGSGRFRGRLELDPARTRSGQRLVARLLFDTRLQGASSKVIFGYAWLTGVRWGGASLSNTRGHPGCLFIIEQEPLLDMATGDAPNSAALVLYGRPGALYHLQRSSSLRPGAVWTTVQDVPLAGAFQVIQPPAGPGPATYFRALAE